MLNKTSLKDLLHQAKFTKTDKLLLCLAVDHNISKTIKTIKDIAINAGLNKVNTWNVSTYLSRSKGKAIRTPKGWELTSLGKKRVSTLAGPSVKTSTPRVASSLRGHLAVIKDPQTEKFIDEAILCFESKFYRAAVVLSWIGAISLLYDFIVNNKLSEFNTEAKRRDSKWKNAKNKDDLTRLKEYDFLQIISAISVIGKSVKTELEACLKFRNGCGHPNSLAIGENRVSAHVETLILNVFSKFN